MRLQRPRRRKPEPGRHVVPRGGEQLVLRPRAGVDRGHDPALALEPDGYAPDRARERVLAIGDTVRTVLDMAQATGTTPLAAAQELARRRLAEVGEEPQPPARQSPVDGGL